MCAVRRRRVVEKRRRAAKKDMMWGGGGGEAGWGRLKVILGDAGGQGSRVGGNV